MIWFIKFLQKIKGGTALPAHLAYVLHDDYVWPFCYVPRELTSYKLRPFPLLLVGYDVRRWMGKNDREAIHTGCKAKWAFWQQKKDHGPSPLQKRSKWSFQLTWPLHTSFSYKFKGSDKVLFMRFGCRWDSLDKYYTVPGIYIGLAWN